MPLGGPPEPTQGSVEALVEHERKLWYIMPKRKPTHDRLAKANKFLDRCHKNLIKIRIIGAYPGIKYQPNGPLEEWMYKDLHEYTRELAWFSRFSHEECDRLWEANCRVLKEEGIDPDPKGIFKRYVDLARPKFDMLEYRERMKTFLRNRRFQAKMYPDDGAASTDQD